MIGYIITVGFITFAIYKVWKHFKKPKDPRGGKGKPGEKLQNENKSRVNKQSEDDSRLYMRETANSSDDEQGSIIDKMRKRFPNVDMRECEVMMKNFDNYAHKLNIKVFK